MRSALLHVVALILALGFSCGAEASTVLTVTSASDEDTDDAQCTLREAIVAANTHASYHGCMATGTGTPATIAFAIPGVGVQHIGVGSRLPPISVPVILDGTTQSGTDCAQWPPTLRIEIDGAANGTFNGLTLSAGSDGSLIRGLVIAGFDSAGGFAGNFDAAINIASNGNHVECNFLGTEATGTVAAANLRAIDIDGASNNVIGSDGLANRVARNLLSGNTYGQVDLRGGALSGNRISGNFIGTDVTGTAAIGGGVGVDISANPGPAHGNFIGWDGIGAAVSMRNVIAGITATGSAGVQMELGANGNRVAGNYIGTDLSGTHAIPNWAGVSLGSNATVFGNVIGNDTTLDPVAARNVIAGNAFVDIEINAANGTHDNAVIGNYIGVAANGASSLGGTSYGISMEFASANTLVARNWIAGQQTAIRFYGSPDFGGGATAAFINNAGAANANLPAIDSRDNCVLDADGVQVQSQGSALPAQNVFANNWWGAADGPNTPGAASADASIAVAPALLFVAAVCSDVVFRDGFEGIDTFVAQR